MATPAVLYLSPSWPPEQRKFTAALRAVDARVLGVGDTPLEAIPAATRACLHDYLQVPSMSDAAEVVRRAAAWAGGRVDLVETNWEVTVIAAARLRRLLDLPGMNEHTVVGFRDKTVMRARLAAAGLPVPRTVRVRGRDEAVAAAREIGGRVVFKPVDGAGGVDTHVVQSGDELARLLRGAGAFEAQVEEHVEGEELTWETICANGVIQLESVSAYFPNVLDARRNEWISPIIATMADLSVPAVQGGLALGRSVLATLGMGTGFTHMEWFRRADGSVVFGEIACRAPGALMVDLMCAVFDADIYQEWARAAVWGDTWGPFERKWNAALVFKRALGDGHIVAHRGLDALARYADRVVRLDLLPIGAPRRDWRNTFLSDGHVLVRHETWEGMWEAASCARDDVRVLAR